MTGWLSEIRRRNVFKVGAAYLVVGWVLIQIADTVAPQLNLPDWAPRLITLVILLGFPIALVLAWIFDLTPAGIKSESDRSKDKGIFALAAIVFLAVVAWFIVGMDRPSRSDGRSIAVLPFVNMSEDAGNQYFSDGISEELLNVLARIPDLRVAARTSSFAFKGKQMEVPEIAERLNVELILEGSVRRQDDQVRITAQLIDADTGFHLWSNNFDRNLEDVFAVQDEIARAVAKALELQLGAVHAAAGRGRPIDPDAYDMYLQARALFRERGGESLTRAIALFEAAIAEEPDFAEAYAGLGLTYAVIPFYTTVPRELAHEKSRNAAEHALALDPTLADAFGALGDVAIHAMRFDDAEALLQRTIELSPSLSPGHYWLAEKHLYVGDLEKAMQELEIVRDLEPLSRAGGYLRSMTYLAGDRHEEARDACQVILDAAPGFDSCRAALLIIALGNEDLASAGELLITSPNAQHEPGRELAKRIADALAGDGDSTAVAQLLHDMPYHANFDPDIQNVIHDKALPALILALGQPDLALDRFLHSAESEPKDVFDMMWDPGLDVIRCESRFQDVVAQLGVVDYRAERVCETSPE